MKYYWWHIGDILKISIIKKNPKKKFLKNKIYSALLVSSSKHILRKNGSYLYFKKNSVILITEFFKLLGTRIKGVVVKEILLKYYKKVAKITKKVKHSI